MKKNYLLIIAFFVTLLLFTCKKKEALNIPMQEKPISLNNEEKEALMKETALLLGKVISDPVMQEKLIKEMATIHPEERQISFAKINNDFKHMRSLEQRLPSNNFNAEFKEKINHEFQLSHDEYPTLMRLTSQISKARSAVGLIREYHPLLLDALSSQDLQVFFPYGENPENQLKTFDEYYMTFALMSDSTKNEVVKYRKRNFNVIGRGIVENEFLDDHPVFIIVPKNPDDNIYDLLNKRLPGGNRERVHITTIRDQNTVSPKNSDMPPPSPNQTVELKYNVLETDIHKDDIISTKLEKITFKSGRKWMGFGGTHLKLVIFRGAAQKSDATVEKDGTLTIKGSQFTISDIRIPRRQIKDELWIPISEEFDSDWSADKRTQAIAVFSRHHLSFTASLDQTVKSGLKFDIAAKKLSASFEITQAINFKIKLGSARARANSEVSRRIMLSSIEGPGLSGLTHRENGIEYNVKKVGRLMYYFKVYYTKGTR